MKTRKEFIEKRLQLIKEMCHAFLPNMFEYTITNPMSPLPKAMPEAMGKTVWEGTVMALLGESEQLREAGLFALWDSLPDRPEIHRYAGFHVVCDALDGGWKEE